METTNANLEKRYVVGWEPREERVLVFVYDKLSRKVVYKIITQGLKRKTTYPYIQNYYGKDNCVPPKQLDVRFYEN